MNVILNSGNIAIKFQIRRRESFEMNGPDRYRACGVYNFSRDWIDAIRRSLTRDFGLAVEPILENTSFYPPEPLKRPVFQTNYDRVLDQTRALIQEKNLDFLVNVNTHGWIRNPRNGKLNLDEIADPPNST